MITRNTIKKIAIGLSSLCLCLGLTQTPVFAAENGTLTIFSSYDEGLNAQTGDTFVIHVESDTVEKDITFDASEAVESGIEVSLPTGTYNVTEIQYQGYNEKIKNSAYGIVSAFTITDEESYAELTVSLGLGTTELLQVQYSDTLLKQNDTYVEYVDVESKVEQSLEETQKPDPETEQTETESPETSVTEIPETENPDEEETEVEKPEVEEKPSQQAQKPEVNHAARLIPIAVICAIFGIVMYRMHKKGKI